MMKRIIVLAAGLAAGLAVLAAGCATERASTDAAPARVEIAVTDGGFVPSSVNVPAGRPVTLVVTRKVEQTCATGIVLAGQGIQEDLPLGQPVEITFTPKGKEVAFSCPMQMISGKLVVQ